MATKLTPQEKKDFQRITAEIGTTPSNALRMFGSAFNRRGGCPFNPSNPYSYNQATLDAMEDAALGRNLLGPFPSANDMITALLTDDDSDDA
ncbi:MAG: type II toxin-antitoxin system RelB/DinJ family antitoxin [Propionibacteriaceae bacterium]|nr:type II toxin-antitoxin system RelB/DinJ family antitoxin [Propionibacteriaceae bacterium]